MSEDINSTCISLPKSIRDSGFKCKDRIGEVVRGRAKVDKYGDSFQATNVEGDHWRIRHDKIKMTLFNLCCQPMCQQAHSSARPRKNRVTIPEVQDNN